MMRPLTPHRPPGVRPRRPAALLLATALAAAAALGVGGDASAAPAPAEPSAATAAAAADAFYLPPSPLPAGSPGDIIRWRKTTTAPLFGGLPPAKADAYQMMYLSTNNTGKPIAVTGTVFVPQGRVASTLPIIGYAPTTHGIGDPCAASIELVAGQDTDLININDAISRGWAVADGDYEGMGTPGDHTYVVGRVEGHTVLDSVRAAQRLTVAGLSRTAPVGLWGYSQGGGAVAWAAQLAGSYAPELKLKGTAAGGTPANLDVVARQLNHNVGFAYLMMAASGLNAAYPELKLSTYLNDAGRAAITDLQTTCVNQALVTYAGKQISELTVKNPLDQPNWQARVAQQKLGLIRPSQPVFLYHGLQDEFIPFSQAVQLKKDWCTLGQRVAFGTFFGDHISTFLAGEVDAENYLAARLAGKPAPSSC